MADVTQNIDVRIQTAIEASNSAKTLTELKSSMRELNSLALESGDTQSAAYIKAATAAGQARDRVSDLRAQTTALSGSKLENLSNSFTLVGNSVASMDFGAATAGIKGFTTTLKGFSFAEIATEIKGLTIAFGELALAILANPITWIAIAIIALIAAFGDLSAIVDYISLAVRKLTDVWFKFTDALGLTHNQLEKNTKALNDYVTGLEAATKANQDLAKAQGQTGNLQTYQILNAEVLKANQGLEYQLNLLNFTQKQIKELNSLLTEDANWNKMILERLKPGITPDQIDAITKAYIDLGKAVNDVKVFTAQLVLENKKLAAEVTEGIANVYAEGIHNHRKAEIEREKIAYESVKRINKIKEEALVEELKTLKESNRTANSEEQAQRLVQIQNIENQLAVLTNQTLLAKVKQREGIKKINDKYDIEDKANVLKNLKSDYDAITNNTKLTENQKYLLHEENLAKQIKASDEYYDKQLEAEKGDAAKTKQLNKDKEVAHQQLEDQKYKVSSDYYDKANKLSLDELNKTIELGNKKAQFELENNQRILDYKLKHLQDLQNIDEMELANMRTNHNKKFTYQFSAERDLIRKIRDDKNAVYLEQANKEKADDAIKKAAEIAAIGNNNLLKEQIEAQHQQVIADIDARYKANVTQNNINSERAITDNQLSMWNMRIAFAQAAADTMNAIFDWINQADQERVKQGTMSDKEAKSKAFKRQKASGVASAIINTAAGITQALGSLPPPYSMIMASIVGATGLIQVAKIMSMKEPTDSASGSAGSVPSPTSPDFGSAPTSNTSSMFNPSAFYGMGTQRTETSTYGHKEAQRVYVVESDITSTQKRVEVNESRATLSGVR